VPSAECYHNLVTLKISAFWLVGSIAEMLTFSEQTEVTIYSYVLFKRGLYYNGKNYSPTVSLLRGYINILEGKLKTHST